MNEKFTPGPWRVTYNHAYEGFQGLGIIGTVVCVTIGDINVPFGAEGLQCCTDEREHQYHTAVANARLIAAAPKMYKSNETTLRELENIVSGLDHACGHCDRYLMRGKRACRNCAAEKARKTAQGMRDRISELQKKARGEQEK